MSYDTTYYWKVRAISLDSQSGWSAVGAFTTEPLLPEQPSSEQSSPSSPSDLLPPAESQPIISEWVIYLIGGLLMVIILQVVAILVLVGRMRRF